MAEQSSEVPVSDERPSTRRPYRGSCHCGHIKYIVYLTLPPPFIHANPPIATSTVRLRKCNCSTCHKMGYFHVRPMDSPNDFQLLSPSDPSELSDYTCFEKVVHWYFCGKCGVHCFSFNGASEVKEAEVDGEKMKIWAPKAEGWAEAKGMWRRSYLSVNAQTLEPNQEGLNLLEWTEKQWIAYIDCLYMEGEARLKTPYPGGTY